MPSVARPSFLQSRCVPLLLCSLLAACAAPAPTSTVVAEADEPEEESSRRTPVPPVVLDGTAWQNRNHIEGLVPGTRWEHQVYASRRPTLYRATEHAGRPAVMARAEGANSTLSLPLNPPPGALPRRPVFVVRAGAEPEVRLA